MKLFKSLVFYIVPVVFSMYSCEENEAQEIDVEVNMTSIQITTETQSLLLDATIQMSITTLPSDATNKTVVWSSSDETIATVDINGLVTALGVGEVTILVKSTENLTVGHSITLIIGGSIANEITNLSINNKKGFLISENTFGLQLPEGTDITSLQPVIEYNGETIEPSIDTPLDFSNPITFTITSESGDTQEWIVKVITVQPPPISSGFVTTWVTHNEGLSSDYQISIPTFEGLIYDYNVDWGDGSSDNNLSGNATHSYEIPGIYSVVITGEFPRIHFNTQFYESDSDSKKLILINHWGNIQWNDFSRAFKGCTELDVIATDVPDLDNVFTAHEMFRFCSKLVGNTSFENWDVSNIAFASFMFAECDLFNQNIGSWDVSNMKDMTGFFENTATFNQDIGNWDLNNVEKIRTMFQGAKAFNQDIGAWNFPKVTDLSTMFQSAKAFNQDISEWNVSKVENFSAIFNGAQNFNQPIGSWDMSGAIDLSAMFQGADSFSYDITNWNVSNVKEMSIMFANNDIFNQDISVWDVSNVENIGGLFWNNSVFNQDLSAWNISNVKNMQKMFKGAIAFDKNIGSWNIGNVENMLEMFEDTGLSIENYDATLIGWNNLPKLKTNVKFNGGSSSFCSSQTARQNLIDTYGWTIVDAGKNCN